jgi:type II secretion system protein N
MNPQRLRLPITKTNLIYGMVFLGAAVFWSMALFPNDLLPRWLENEFNTLHAEDHLRISIASAVPQLPAGIELKGVGLWWSGLHLIEVDKMHIRLGWPSWRPPKLPLHLNATLHGGQLIAQSALDLGESNNANITAIQLDDIDLHDLPAWQQWPKIQLAGVLGAYVTTVNLASAGAGLTLAAQITIKAFALTRPSPYPSMKTFQFETIEGEVRCTSAQITLQDILAQGGDIDTRFSGQLQLRNPVQSSVVNLNGSALPGKRLLSRLKEDFPDAPFEALANGERIAFRVQGRLDKPRWGIN